MENFHKYTANKHLIKAVNESSVNKVEVIESTVKELTELTVNELIFNESMKTKHTLFKIIYSFCEVILLTALLSFFKFVGDHNFNLVYLLLHTTPTLPPKDVMIIVHIFNAYGIEYDDS